MFWSKATALAACGAVLASAHGDSAGPIPRLGGDPQAIADLTGRDGILNQMHVLQTRSSSGVERRQQADPERCGAGVGKCQEGYCCSSAGWCGNTASHCWSPDCQIDYGDGCDGNQKPKGEDTSKVNREKVGNLPYGTQIRNCTRKGDIAITYDDGPYLYTGDLLDIFKKFGGKATFFINGNNKGKGQINDPEKQWGDIIKRMASEGHQVASHSWSHQNSSQLTEEQLRNQIIWNEIAINDILGYFPTYYRPPYSICSEECQKTLAELGYHNIDFNLDTDGLANDDPLEIGKSKKTWDDNIEGTNACEKSWLHIEHDLQVQTVYNLTAHMLQSLYQNGYRSVTVGECLGDPAENWYRSGGGEIPKYNFPVKENVCDGSSPPSMISYEPTIPTIMPTPTDQGESSDSPTDAAASSPSGGAGMVRSHGSSVVALAAGVVAAAAIF